MTLMRFVKFTEHNDWEGETWNFWLQLDGNEEALAKLARLIRTGVDVVDDPAYEIDVEHPADESVVDALIEHMSDEGYMPEHSKVIGVLTVPDDLGEHLDALYKGQVADFFQEG